MTPKNWTLWEVAGSKMTTENRTSFKYLYVFFFIFYEIFVTCLRLLIKLVLLNKLLFMTQINISRSKLIICYAQNTRFVFEAADVQEWVVMGRASTICILIIITST